MATPSLNQITSTLKSSEELENLFMCPLSLDTFEDPVVDKCGHTFERTNIQDWLQKNDTCPLFRERITSKGLMPNRVVKQAIDILKRKGRSQDGSVAVADKQEREMVIRAVKQLRPNTFARKSGDCVEKTSNYLSSLC
jgi:hypothetical protein